MVKTKIITNRKTKKNDEKNKKLKNKKTDGQYACNVCTKLFKHWNSLDKHLRTHLYPENVTLFPYRCDKCNKTFSKIQNMNTHRALIHELLPIT